GISRLPRVFTRRRFFQQTDGVNVTEVMRSMCRSTRRFPGGGAQRPHTHSAPSSKTVPTPHKTQSPLARVRESPSASCRQSGEKQQHATEPSRKSIDRDVDECFDPVAQLSGERHVKQFHTGPVQGVARGGFCEAN